MSEKPSFIRFAGDTVIKSFNEAVLFYRELTVYQRHLPATPKLLGFVEPLEIVLERISGIPYTDDPDGFDSALLAKRIAAFHLSSFDGDKCLCHIDNQPKNILYDGNDYYLIDFSDSRFETPEYDLSHLMLFWADMFEPARMQSLVGQFLSEYQKLASLDSDRWESCLRQNILRFDERRAQYNKKPPLLTIEMISENRDYLFGTKGSTLQ
ncbi:MAG: phosphotransferase [Candidatus Cloacimonadaceae bacterium]|nr:phosphotransferase [Candidatus Cloacimonadaceae bacterium]MDP3114619.1 phosphotransferase [Candidatus Cloacimonadaceae bacterium]